MDSKTLARIIGTGFLDDRFKVLYASEDIRFHRERWISLLKNHSRVCKDDSPRLFSAPGRTELAGNHTDHNRGRVLAASVQLDTIAAVTHKEGNIAEVLSEGYPPVRVDLSMLEKMPKEVGRTDALVRGIAASIVKRGGRIGGFTASTSSRVLKGSGLSSSAALEILVGSIFNELYNEGRFNTIDLAMMGQEAENTYFEKPSGLMDQCACAAGGAIAIDFADPARPVVEPIQADFATAGYTLAVVDSRADHADLTDDYASIPTEMAAVATELGYSVLQEVPQELFYSSMKRIRHKVGDRALLRALHFYQENLRVQQMTQALRKKDLPAYLDGVRRSGHSSFCFLQNIYSPDNPENQAVSLALALSESYLRDSGACRVHGGGFAGTIQVFVPDKDFDDYRSSLDNFFGKGSVLPLSIRPIPAGEIHGFR